MEEKEINYETAYKRALNKIAQLKEDVEYWRKQYEGTAQLRSNFIEQVNIQVAIKLQKFHEDYITFVQSITKMLEVKK